MNESYQSNGASLDQYTGLVFCQMKKGKLWLIYLSIGLADIIFEQ